MCSQRINLPVFFCPALAAASLPPMSAHAAAVAAAFLAFLPKRLFLLATPVIGLRPRGGFVQPTRLGPWFLPLAISRAFAAAPLCFVEPTPISQRTGSPAVCARASRRARTAGLRRYSALSRATLEFLPLQGLAKLLPGPDRNKPHNARPGKKPHKPRTVQLLPPLFWFDIGKLRRNKKRSRDSDLPPIALLASLR